MDRALIWRILKHCGISQKIVNNVQSLYEDTSCRVIHKTDLCAPFTVNTGVRQGSILSLLIFSLVIEWAMTTMEQPGGIQWTLMQKLEDLDFADDVSLLSRSQGNMQNKTERLHDVLKTTGLQINVTKFKSLRVNASRKLPSPLMVRPLRAFIRLHLPG